MKKQILILIILFAILSIAWRPISLKLMKLKGPVKTLIERQEFTGGDQIFVQEFNKDGLLSEMKVFDVYRFYFDCDSASMMHSINPNYLELDSTSPNYLYKIQYKYNQNNMIINEISTNAKGLIFVKRNYQYDKLDSLINEQYYYYNSKGEITDSSITNHKYSISDNSFIKETIKGDDTTYTISIYDNNNRIMKQYNYESIDSLDLYITTFTYDNKNNLIQEKQIEMLGQSNYEMKIIEYSFNKNNKLTSKKTSWYTFYKLSKLIKQTYLYRFGRLKKFSHSTTDYYETSNTFNKNNHILNKNGDIKRSVLEDNIEAYKFRFEFEYDKYDNWIQRIEFRNDIPEDTVKRIILYYE